MNYIKVAFRNFKKYRQYTIINLIGLVLGLTVSFVLLGYVQFELSFDRFHKGAENIYRIEDIETTPDGVEHTPFTRILYGEALAERIPEIESFNRIAHKGNQLFKWEEKTIKAEYLMLYADDNFFSFFSFPLLVGGHNYQLNKGEVVLSERMAKRLFGNENPIGQHIEINDKPFIVAALAANHPKNSHIKFDAVSSIRTLLDSPDVYKGWNGGQTVQAFVSVNDKANFENINTQTANLLWEKVNKKEDGTDYFTEFVYAPFSEIHLFSDVDWDNFGKADINTVLILLGIGILVLLIAIINFISISKGVLVFRNTSFVVKRTFGSGRFELTRQLFAENVLIFALTTLLTIGIIWAFQSQFCSLFGYSFNFYDTQILQKIIAVFLLVLVFIVVTTLFSTYSQQKTLSTRANAANLKLVRNTSKLAYVAIFQFVISITLIVGVIVVQKQLNYALNKDLGFKKENIVQISNHRIGQKQDVLRQELGKVEGVKSVSSSFGLPGLECTMNGYRPQESDQWFMYNALHADENFLDAFEINLVKGRNFINREKGNEEFLVNQTLAKSLGWENPIGKTLFRGGKNYEIVGVVEDFHIASLYNKIEPLIISMQYNEQFYALSISVETEKMGAALKEIEKVWTEVVPGVPFDYTFYDQLFARLYSEVERTKQILVLFSVIAILVSMLGIFGVTLMLINSRVKEIGIRKVNGAKVSEILTMLNRDFVKWVTFAFVIACPVAWYTMNNWLSNFAYKTDLSWWIFALAGAVAFSIALLTVSWQSWKAARRNPVEALRYE
jgi:putative ABC transport system permease protein